MRSLSANPDLLLQRWLWHNRMRAWRAQAAETAFTACAFAAFIGIGLWIADPQWTALLRADAAWARPLPASLAGLIVAAMLAMRAYSQRRRFAGRERNDWLAALPIAARLRAQARGQRVLLASAWSALALVALVAWATIRARQPAPGLPAALVVAAAIGVVAAWLLPESGAAPETIARRRAAAVSIAAGTRGLALLGAALEPAVTRLPRGAPWVAACFMLLPPSTPAIAVPGLLLLFSGISLAFDLIAHWRERYLADQAWLATQPLAPATLLRAYLAPLARRGTLLALLVGACLHALGAPLLFSALLVVALWLLLADAVLCVYATRRAPWRFPLLLLLHGAALAASLQVLPPAMPLVLGACAWSAWRRGNR